MLGDFLWECFLKRFISLDDQLWPPGGGRGQSPARMRSWRWFTVCLPGTHQERKSSRKVRKPGWNRSENRPKTRFSILEVGFTQPCTACRGKRMAQNERRWKCTLHMVGSIEWAAYKCMNSLFFFFGLNLIQAFWTHAGPIPELKMHQIHCGCNRKPASNWIPSQGRRRCCYDEPNWEFKAIIWNFSARAWISLLFLTARVDRTYGLGWRHFSGRNHELFSGFAGFMLETWLGQLPPNCSRVSARVKSPSEPLSWIFLCPAARHKKGPIMKPVWK